MWGVEGCKVNVLALATQKRKEFVTYTGNHMICIFLLM